MKHGCAMGPLLTDSYDKVCAVISGIDGFAKDNIIFRAVIALGVLVVLCPDLVEKLGFLKCHILEGASSKLLGIHDEAD